MNNKVYIVELSGVPHHLTHTPIGVITDLNGLNKVRDYIKKEYGITFKKEAEVDENGDIWFDSIDDKFVQLYIAEAEVFD